MPKRTQKYNKLPWTGGINDSVDSGLLPDNDLVQADNVTIGVSGSRLKREGISFFDQLTVPSASSVTRAGTTITVVFSADVITATNKKFVVGEKIAVVCVDVAVARAGTQTRCIHARRRGRFQICRSDSSEIFW